MVLPGMLVRLRKRWVIMVVVDTAADSVRCIWYEKGKRKSAVFCTKELIVVEAGYNHLSYS